jgi:hypothetical protein
MTDSLIIYEGLFRGTKQSVPMSEDDSTLDGNCDARRKSLSDSVAGKDEVAVLMRYEARQTVDNLNSGLTDIDAKASKLMRMNIIVAGLLLSALSFAAKSANVGVEPFINPFSISGLVVLVTSIVAAGSTYSAAESRVGISAETKECVLSQRDDPVRSCFGGSLFRRRIRGDRWRFTAYPPSF